MDEVFQALNVTFSAQDATRETLRQHRDEADVAVRAAQRALAALHTDEDIRAAAAAARKAMAEAGPFLLAIEKALPDEPGAFHRYHDIWRNSLQTAALVAVVVQFIENDTLSDMEKVVGMLGAKIRLPLEDFLMGVCNAISEMARLSMNRVTMGDYVTPRRCATFANNVFEAFKQLNLRNDFLRKRYDGMKYDVKRMEEIMYDLSIRGLMKTDAAADSDAPMGQAEEAAAQ